MLEQVVLTMLWTFVTCLVLLKCATRRTTAWTIIMIFLVSIPAMDTNMFPEPVDPEEAYMRMTKDLPYQLGDWRVDIYPVCCFKKVVPMYKLHMYRGEMD